MKAAYLQNQHLALKTAIFVIGIFSAFEANLRQLALQSILTLIFMFFEPRIFKKLIFALRRLLFFFAAYWLFATLFGLDFMGTLIFSGKILFLLLLMVYLMAAVNKELILWQLRYFLRCKYFRSLIFYTLAVYYFMKAYFVAYSRMQSGSEISGILQKALQAGAEVQAQSEEIRHQVSAELSDVKKAQKDSAAANLWGFVFLLLLVILHAV